MTQASHAQTFVGTAYGCRGLRGARISEGPHGGAAAAKEAQQVRQAFALQLIRGLILSATVAGVVWLYGCSRFDGAIYVNCDLVSAKGFSDTDSSADQAAKIPWIRNVKSFTGKFPIGWSERDATFAGTDVHVSLVSDTTLEGTLKYMNHLIEQPDGSFLYDRNGKPFDYTFTFNRLNDQLSVIGSTKDPSAGARIKYQILDFACRRVTP